MNIFIIHGSYGSANGNWFPWLKKELEEREHAVFVPQFPVGIGKQSLSSWLAKIGEYKGKLDGAVFIGHSIAPAFILRLLEERRAKACFFVSGFLDLLGNEEYDAVNKSFVEREFDWSKIKKNCSQFHVFYGDDDPYVPQESLKRFAELIGVKPTVIAGGKHLNAESGWTEFPQLLEAIEKL